MEEKEGRERERLRRWHFVHFSFFFFLLFLCSQCMHTQHVGGRIDWDQTGGGMDWSFGESIMRAVSQHGVTLFDIENPTHDR